MCSITPRSIPDNFSDLFHYEQGRNAQFAAVNNGQTLQSFRNLGK
jgi:hypothetical protein